MEACKHIVAIDFAHTELAPPVVITATDDQPNPLAERVHCSFCLNCGAKLQEPDSKGRIYGLKNFEFIFNPPDTDDKRRFDIRLFRFCINTGQFNGEVGKIYI